MKTKAFLALCLFISIGLTQVSAQNGKDGTGAVTFTSVWDGYWQPVYCNGVNVDNLTGTVTQHFVQIFKAGVFIKANARVTGEAVSENPPYEVFKVSEIDHADGATTTTIWHFNLIGNFGTHYIGTMVWNWETQEMWVDKAVCPSGKQ